MNASSGSGATMRFRHTLRQVRRVGTTAFALVGLGATAYMAYEYNELKKAEKKAETKEKTVLVLPFDRMQLRETKKRSLSFDSSWFSSEDDGILQVSKILSLKEMKWEVHEHFNFLNSMISLGGSSRIGESHSCGCPGSEYCW